MGDKLTLWNKTLGLNIKCTWASSESEVIVLLSALRYVQILELWERVFWVQNKPIIFDCVVFRKSLERSYSEGQSREKRDLTDSKDCVFLNFSLPSSPRFVLNSISPPHPNFENKIKVVMFLYSSVPKLLLFLLVSCVWNSFNWIRGMLVDKLGS